MRRALAALALSAALAGWAGPAALAAPSGPPPPADGGCPPPTQNDLPEADVAFQGAIEKAPPAGRGGDAEFVVLQPIKGDDLRPGQKVTVRLSAAPRRPVPELNEGDVMAVLAEGADGDLTTDMCHVVLVSQAGPPAEGGESSHEPEGLPARTIAIAVGLLLLASIIVVIPGFVGRAEPGTPSH